MPENGAAFLVVRDQDSFGEVFVLNSGERHTLGRANTSRIVLRDDLCSREHAEVFFGEGRWRVRDLKSLNGTRVNNVALSSEWELSPEDEIQLGRTRLVFLDKEGALPVPPTKQEEEDASASCPIKKRIGPYEILDADAALSGQRHSKRNAASAP